MKYNYHLRLQIVAISVSLSFLLGCATTGKVPERETMGRIPSLRIGGVRYLPLKSVCQTYQVNWQWDPITKKATLQKDGLDIKLRVGSTLALINNKLSKMENEVKFYDGAVVIPASFFEKSVYPFFAPDDLNTDQMPARFLTHEIKLIVIDPGHGGKDPGAVGTGGSKEKDVALDIARKLKDELDGNGVNVILTRDEDEFISLGDRVDIANAKKTNLFVSIHANASRIRKACGFEIYYLSDAVDDSARVLASAKNASLEFEKSSFYKLSDDLEATLWDLIYTENRAESIELADYLCKVVSRELDIKNRGVKRAPFYILNKVMAPSVLVEVGFISNDDEETKMNSDYYRQQIAEVLAKGIFAYKREYERTDGFTD